MQQSEAPDDGEDELPEEALLALESQLHFKALVVPYATDRGLSTHVVMEQDRSLMLQRSRAEPVTYRVVSRFLPLRVLSESTVEAEVTQDYVNLATICALRRWDRLAPRVAAMAVHWWIEARAPRPTPPQRSVSSPLQRGAASPVNVPAPAKALEAPPDRERSVLYAKHLVEPLPTPQETNKLRPLVHPDMSPGPGKLLKMQEDLEAHCYRIILRRHQVKSRFGNRFF